VLLRAGIVDCRKEGLRQIYRLKTPCVADFLTCVSRVLRRQLAEETAVLARL